MILFESSSTDLVNNFVQLNPNSDVYVRNLTSNQTSLVSAAVDNVSGANRLARIDDLTGDSRGQISPNGRYVVFESNASNLVASFVDINSASSDLYERDTLTGTTYLVSGSSASSGGNDRTSANALSFPRPFTVLNDGRVVFYSYSSNLVTPPDGNDNYDVFIANPAAVSGGAIHGTVFEDVDSDGIRDNGEPALAGYRVYVDANLNGQRDGNELSTTTSSDGTYALSGLATGSYRVRVETPSADQILVPASGFHNVTLNSDDQIVVDQDFADHILRPDLVVSNIQVPGTTLLGATISISWTVTNQGDGAVASEKSVDEVYLSEDDVLDSADLLLGSVVVVDNLAAEAHYVGTLTTALPAIYPISYHVIVQTDSRQPISETNEANNVTTATDLLAINSIDLSSADQGGPATIKITGSRLNPSMLPSLVDGSGNEYFATQVYPVDATQIYATFNLPAIPVGNYSVKVVGVEEDLDIIRIDGESHYRYRRSPVATTLSNAFTVNSAQPDDVDFTIESPGQARAVLAFTSVLTIQNLSHHDVPAPIVIVQSDHPTYSVTVDGVPSALGTLVFEALGQSASPGILRPGEQVVIPVRFKGPPHTVSTIVNIGAGLAHDDENPINWDPYLTSLGADVSDPVWVAAVADFKSFFWDELECVRIEVGR
ncbi:MAG: repeat-associated core domain protein [Planctomycetaceae bacterium]|nr:repeat-associated core domain protein [Planctomycetaceae bacterium]